MALARNRLVFFVLASGLIFDLYAARWILSYSDGFQYFDGLDDVYGAC